MTSPLLVPDACAVYGPKAKGGPRHEWEFDGGGRVAVRYAADVAWLQYPPKFIPAAFSVEVDLPSFDYGVDGEVEIRDGSPRLMSVTVRSRRTLVESLQTEDMPKPQYRSSTQETELTSLGMRQVRPSLILRYGVAAAVAPAPFADPGQWPDVTSPSDVLDAFGQTERPAHRRTFLTPELLAEVARVYQEAERLKEPPTRAVARHFFLAAGTADKWVRRARQDGMLPRRGAGASQVAAQPVRRQRGRIAT